MRGFFVYICTNILTMLITDRSTCRAHFREFLKMCCSLEKGKRYFVQWLSLEMDSYVHNTEVLRLNSFNVVLGAIKVLTVEPESMRL
jgi:hypothetical protein